MSNILRIVFFLFFCGVGVSACASGSHQSDVASTVALDCSNIRIQLPSWRYKRYSSVPGFERTRHGETVVRFSVLSDCPVVSVKVVLESQYEARPDLIADAKPDLEGERGSYRVGFDLPPQGFSEILVIQIIAVSESGEAAVLVDTVQLADALQLSDIQPEIKKDWWGGRLIRTDYIEN